MLAMILPFACSYSMLMRANRRLVHARDDSGSGGRADTSRLQGASIAHAFSRQLIDVGRADCAIATRADERRDVFDDNPEAVGLVLLRLGRNE
jgi:hypothetical protein